MSGGSQKKTTENSSTSATKGPLEAQAGFYSDLWNRARGAMDQTQGKTSGIDPLALASPLELGGISDLAAAARNAGVGAGAVRGLAHKTAGGEFLPSLEYRQNPGLPMAIAAALDPVQRQLTQVALPAVRSAAISQGAYGGARQDLQENQALNDWTREAGNISATMSYKDMADDLARRYGLYSSERTLQQNAPTLFQAASALEKAPAMTMLEAGGLQRSMDQIPIENALARFREGQTAPWYGLGEMAQILQAGGFGTTNSTTTGVKKETVTPDLATEIFKGLLGTASLGTGMARGLGWSPFGKAG